MESAEKDVHAILDRSTIARSISSLSASLVNATKIGSNLWHLHDVFDNGDISTIISLVDKGSWWRKPVLQQHLDRLELPFKMDSVTENLWEIFDSVRTQLNKNFNQTSVTIWRDGSNFKMPVHLDNDRVHAAIQIYLGDNDGPGTTFYPGGNKFEVPYRINTGYLMLNSDEMMHGVIAEKPHQGRLSIYAVYG